MSQNQAHNCGAPDPTSPPLAASLEEQLVSQLLKKHVDLHPSIATPLLLGVWQGPWVFKEQVLWVWPAGIEVGLCVSGPRIWLATKFIASLIYLGLGVTYPSVGPPPARGGQH